MQDFLDVTRAWPLSEDGGMTLNAPRGRRTSNSHFFGAR
jgi:hypothetical protein